MTAEKTLAVVLRLVEFSESSYVVTLFTEDFGKVTGMAKGARRPKSAFESALDLLSISRIVFLRKSSDTLDLLTEAKLERPFRSAGTDLNRLYAAFYVAELLNAFTDAHDPQPGLFRIVENTIRSLDGVDKTNASSKDFFLAATDLITETSLADAPKTNLTTDLTTINGAPKNTAADVGRQVLQFEMSMLKTLGHLPSLHECIECGGLLLDTPRIAFSQIAGGVLCNECKSGKRQVASLSLGAIGILRRLALDEVTDELEIDGREYGEVRAVMSRYVSHLLGRRPRLLDFLGYA